MKMSPAAAQPTAAAERGGLSLTFVRARNNTSEVHFTQTGAGAKKRPRNSTSTDCFMLKFIEEERN